MPGGPSDAYKRIGKYLTIDQPPLRLTELLATIIAGEGWFTGADAAEKAEGWRSAFLFRVEEAIRDEDDLGWVNVFALNSASNSYIQGSCYCEPGDGPEIVAAKRNRSNTLKMREHLTDISPRAFEIVCKRLLALLGVDDPHASRASKDEGVDFYGLAPVGKILKKGVLPAGAEKQLRLWYVGQAKRYRETKVSTNELRDLIGSTEMARAKVFASSTDPLKDFSARLCDPVISLLVTTGVFTRDSISLLKSAGVVAMDGLQLSQFLADHEAGIAEGSFDSTLFNSWLSDAT